MIYSITFNPALDVSGLVENLVPNEKSYVFDEIHLPGGNGINAGIIAGRLGSQVILSGFLGGTNGREISELLSSEKVRQDFISISGKTRMNLTVSNRETHQQTRLSFPGPKIKIREFRDLRTKILSLSSEDILLLGGSLPPGLRPTQVVELVKLARNNRVTCLVDMPGELLRTVVKGKPYFIKPNLTEFQGLVGKKVSKITGVIREARRLLEQVPLICVSSVEGGALLISRDEAWFGKIPQVKIYSTVGAGDSMVGAIAHSFNKKKNLRMEDLLRSGLAASCATLTEKGLTLGSRKNIHHYSSSIKLLRVQ